MLLDLVVRLDKLRAGRLAAHIHLSKLSKAYNSDRYMRIAIDSFNNYVAGFEGHLFPLKNGDLFFIAKDVTSTLLETAVNRIRLLFSQDPLLEQRGPRGGSAFCTYYNLEVDYADVLTLARTLSADVDKAAALAQDHPPKPLAQATPVRPEILSRLEHSLENVDVTNITRRQTVCTIIEGQEPQPLFEEIFISIEDLQRVVTPGIDLAANTWLFRYLTQTLDRRVMLMLIRDGISTSRPFSLNLNVSTILTPEFARFETIISPQLRGRLVIEMNKLDVFSDMGAFLFARDYLHDHGFRLCLDGLTHHTMPFYSRSKLGFDLIKILWAPNALDIILPSMLPDIRNIIMETGQAHTILCRCDDETAIRVGQELGIVMFQGRYVDKALVSTRTQPTGRF